MRVKTDAGSGMREILMVRDEKTLEEAGYRKPRIKKITRRTTILTRQCRDKYSEFGGMAGLSKKIVAGCGICW